VFPVRSRHAAILALLLAACALASCGGGSKPIDRTPWAAPAIHLTAQEQAIWKPLPVRRDAIPVLVYHGIDAPDGFSRHADSFYGIRPRDFAKQMLLLRTAGYQTIGLEQFARFQRGDRTGLPTRPLLITFDDARLDSYQGADGVLARLGMQATMFVDVGAVERKDPEYLKWDELRTMQSHGHWDLQLHSGKGHQNISYGPNATHDWGPFYAYRDLRAKTIESFDAWRKRAVSDLLWGQTRLAAEVPAYRPRAFAPPYGNLGQVSTDDVRIPRFLGNWLRQRYGMVFVQEPARYARPGEALVPRFQITRRLSGGDLHAWLAEQLPKA
jgi:peptidoglycan/xylan/chitin deacetylase (PgdA/CDA1 family)